MRFCNQCCNLLKTRRKPSRPPPSSPLGREAQLRNPCSAASFSLPHWGGTLQLPWLFPPWSGTLSVLLGPLWQSPLWREPCVGTGPLVSHTHTHTLWGGGNCSGPPPSHGVWPFRKTSQAHTCEACPDRFQKVLLTRLEPLRAALCSSIVSSSRPT